MQPQEPPAVEEPATGPERPAEWYVGRYILVRRPMLPAVASYIDRCIYEVTGIRGAGRNKGRQLYIKPCGKEITPRKFTRLGSHIAAVFDSLHQAEQAAEVLRAHAASMAMAEQATDAQLNEFRLL